MNRTSWGNIKGLYEWELFDPQLRKERVRAVQLLIQHGAGVTEKDVGYSTALHLASSSGILEIMKLLIERGADVTAQDRSYRTPLHLASSWVSSNAASESLLSQPDVNTA